MVFGFGGASFGPPAGYSSPLQYEAQAPPPQQYGHQRSPMYADHQGYTDDGYMYEDEEGPELSAQLTPTLRSGSTAQLIPCRVVPAAHEDFYRVEDENTELKAQLERLQAELKEADEAATEVCALVATQRRRRAIATDSSACPGQARTTNSHLKLRCTSAENRSRAMEERLAEEGTKSNEATEKVTKLQREVRKLQASEKGTLQRAEELEEELADLRAQMKARSPRGSSSKAAEDAKREAERKLTEAQASDIDARKQLALTSKAKDDAEREKRILQKQLDGLKKEHQKLKAENDSRPPRCAHSGLAHRTNPSFGRT